MICAAGSTLAAGTVSTLPARLPKLAGLLVNPEFASVQVADVALKLALAASVICTCVFAAVTRMAVGAAGVAVAAATVVMFAGFDAKFVATNVNGPP